MEYPEFSKLVQVVKDLRAPETGCPWDLEQTHSSLLSYLFEESYEFKEAVEQGKPEEMKGELGDILLQVLLHSQIASEAQHFDIEDVAKNLAEKMVRRHPHVFNNNSNEKISSQEVTDNWKLIKEKEKGKKTRAIENKVLHAPALEAAFNIGKKTKLLNFDWSDPSQVAWKVEEEWQELKEELMPSVLNKERIGEELGDFLFSAAQLARHLDHDPEELLQKANRKFLKRFHKVEDLITNDGLNFEDLTQEELDHYWVKVKSEE